MEQHIKLFASHRAYNTVKDQIDKPNVVMCQSEGDIHYNPVSVLPENQGLWEWFNRKFGESVTSDDFEVFSTEPMTYYIENGLDSPGQYSHNLQIYTDIIPCFDETPNPEYKFLDTWDDVKHANVLYFIDENETATINDFVNLSGTAHNWQPASCGK